MYTGATLTKLTNPETSPYPPIKLLPGALTDKDKKSVISYTQLMFDFNVSCRIKTSSAFIRRATKDMPSFKFWLRRDN